MSEMAELEKRGVSLEKIDLVDNSKANKKSVAQLIETYVAKGKNQIIFTGAPGTGKTYSVREYVKDKTDNETEYKFVQFHPSYDYSDFVEGLRPVNVGDSKKPSFVRMDGSFKSFCRMIVEKNLEAAGYGLNKDTLEELYKSISNKKKNNIELDPREAIFVNGEKKYYFIVDEINRADLAKVFGELMFGLEESYRGIENRFDTQYKNLVTYEIVKEEDEKNVKAKPMDFDCFKNGFFIPKNLVFIGTMNDIDRSVESFDFALRRRFQWEEIKANDVMEDALWGMRNKGVIKTSFDLSYVAKCIMSMNYELTSKDNKFGLSDAYHIGPAYFKKVSGDSFDEVRESLANIFDRNVQSIIREYLRGRNPKDVNPLVSRCRDALLNTINESNYKEESNSDKVQFLSRDNLLIRNVKEEVGTYDYIVKHSLYWSSEKQNELMRGFRLSGAKGKVFCIGQVKSIWKYDNNVFENIYGAGSNEEYKILEEASKHDSLAEYCYFINNKYETDFIANSLQGNNKGITRIPFKNLNIPEEYLHDAQMIAELLKGKEWDREGEKLVDQIKN